MKKYVITIILITGFILASSIFINKSNALGLDDMSSDMPGLYTVTGVEDQEGAIEIGNIIVSIVRYIGEAIAIVSLMIIGIRYLLASTEEKAEYKQSMWPYVIGAILLFAGATFTDWIYEIFYSAQ